jgi:hypothetical protein
MQATCPSCERASEDVSESLGLANCHHCGMVYPLGGEQAVYKGPGGVRVHAEGRELHIAVPWIGVHSMGIALGTIAYLGVLGKVSLEADLAKAEPGVLFMVAAGLVGALVLAYLTAAFALNRTEFTATKAGLAVDHTPLPWPGSGILIARRDLTQLYTQRIEREITHRNGRKEIRISYNLVARVRGGQDIELLQKCTDAPPCRFIETAVEAYLGIEDRPMAAEAPKRI